MPEAEWVSIDDERVRYGHHDNTRENAGYVRFLGEVAEVVGGIAPVSARILDFGSGENAVLAHLLRDQGHDCAAYDPLYGIGAEMLADSRWRSRALPGGAETREGVETLPGLPRQYDVIVLCEVIEHLRDLRDELARIRACLAPGGRVVVRTQCYPSLAALPTWWYARDATHINFFAPATLDVAAALCGLVSRGTAAPDIVVWQPG